MNNQQLLTQSEVFEDEIGAGAKRSHQPAENVSKQHNQGTKILPDALTGRFVKRLILRVYEVLTRHRPETVRPGAFMLSRARARPTCDCGDSA